MIGHTAAPPAEYTPNPVRPPPRLVSGRCCLCEDDDAEPVAVGEDFDTGASAETFLVMRCNGCGLVYLALHPADVGTWRLAPDDAPPTPGRPLSTDSPLGRGVQRHLARVARALPRDGRALEIGCADGTRLRGLRELVGPHWTIEGSEPVARAADAAEHAGFRVFRGDIEAVEPAAGYDLVLITGTLAQRADPIGLLSAVASLVRPGGRIVIIVENTATACFRIFRGRHWAGYRFPQRWFWFEPRTLSSLVARAGLRLSRLDSVGDAELWVNSIRHLLWDWRAPAWLVNRVGSTAVVAPALFGAVEAVERLRGRGGLLVAECSARTDAMLQPHHPARPY
jgi:SAM-dependent methyltransferase